MKHGGEYAKRLKHLFNRLIRKYGKPAPCELSDPLEQMLVAILNGNTSHHKATTAFRRLREQMVDLNELRVTPVCELADTLSRWVPYAETKAQRIVDLLSDIRRRHDTLDLSFLRQRGRREGREYLESLEGVDRAAAASVTLFSLGGHAIPVDELTLHVLKREEIVPPEAELVEVQGFIEHHVAAADAMAFTQLLDRHVASSGVRLPEVSAEEPAQATGSENACPAGSDPPAAATTAATAGKASMASRGRRGKPRSTRGNDCPSRARSSSRSSPRSAERRRKAPARRASVKTGRATKRR
jgi:endonuclease III